MDEPRLSEIVEADGTLQSRNLGQTPERCVEDALIWPILETLGYEYTPQPYYPVGDSDEQPDFRIDNLSETVIGENKSVNNFETAQGDIEGYLDSRRYEYGLSTDGFRWGMYAIETDERGRADLVTVVEEQNIAPAVRRIARNQGLVSYTEQLQENGTVEGVLGDFYQTFNHYGIRRAIGGLSEFYDLYLEVTTGSGEYQHLDTALVDAIEEPPDASQPEKLAFAVLLVERLAFVKLLADRGILKRVALHAQWSEHNQGLNRFRGSFYSQYLQPLFYDALSTPSQQRDDGLPEMFGDVPYLGGELFESILPSGRAFDVPDSVMKLVLTQFVENEERTLVNEAAAGSILETYTEEFESRELAGQIPQHYVDIVDAYREEIEYVESEIERTLRSFAATEAQ
ncbi:hypothetical protein PNP85_04720 [Halobacterium salinarum]|nr:hypothetical protein [Halobacterium salinarum]MDL0138807.1 hypothetical protein [Halobacterium salinarum]